jgi:hypothetical protein
LFIQGLGSFEHLVDGALHIEGLFGKFVVFAIHNLAEAADRVSQLDVLAGAASELLSDVEGLGKEALEAAGAPNGLFVVVTELVDAENGDDVLKVFIALEDQFDALGSVVVLVADDARIEDARCGSRSTAG